MCGIVGYIGKKKSIISNVDILRRLEYRGYDSAGVAYFDKKLKFIKSVGQIDNLASKISNQSSGACICHTRWATHGQVNQENAHPQISQNQQFAVVHNGIIENYQELKQQYGLTHFSSQTDTEVIANLLEYFGGSVIDRMTKVVDVLKGSFAIAVMQNSDKVIYVAKNKSPLYIAPTNNGYLVASDISCFSSDKYYCLEDGVVASITPKEIQFYLNGNKIRLEPINNNFDIKQVNIDGFSHYMQKEMAETNKVITNIATRYTTIADELFDEDLFKDIENVYLIGCGTAYHACQMGAIWIEKYNKIKCEACIASEFRYSDPIINKNSLVMLISQSGETADTLAVAQMAKQKGAKIVALTNVEYSSLANMSNKVFPLCAGPEIAVASTKAYTSMLAILYIISHGYKEISHSLQNLSKIKEYTNLQFDTEIINKVKNSKRVFFIGRNTDGITASEGALKLKEIAYLDACGYYAGELKHGTIALVEPNVVVIAIITKLKNKTLNAVEEVMSRGANVIVVTDDIEIHNKYKGILLPKADEDLINILSVLPLQKLAYEVSCSFGYNPDKPRNLAKSVTVE